MFVFNDCLVNIRAGDPDFVRSFGLKIGSGNLDGSEAEIWAQVQFKNGGYSEWRRLNKGQKIDAGAELVLKDGYYCDQAHLGVKKYCIV